MKKIFVIYTGGTICTTLKDGKISIDPTAAAALTTLYKKRQDALPDIEFKDGRFFGILSENMTVENWNIITNYLKETLPTLSDFDGVIMAHGTDTLAFSAALLSQLLKGFSLPVFLVSSNKSIIKSDGSRNPAANGVDNFAAAVSLINSGIKPDVYAPYKNSDGKTYLHKGENLKQCEIYSDDFYSRDMVDMSKALPSTDNDHCSAQTPALFELKKPLKDCVLKIDPYVGLNYSRISLEGVKAVLHTTYHSGTACVDGAQKDEASDCSVLSLIDRCQKQNIPFYFAPAKRGEEQSVYATVPYIEHRNAYGEAPAFCYGDTTETLYAKLIIEYSQK